MGYKLGTRSKMRIRKVHPDLAKVVRRAIEISGVDFTVLEGIRTLKRQKQLVAKGASKTMKSRHLTGHAVDLGAWVGGAVRWDWELYFKIADAMKQASIETGIPIRWGGCWDTRLHEMIGSCAEESEAYVARRRPMVVVHSWMAHISNFPRSCTQPEVDMGWNEELEFLNSAEFLDIIDHLAVEIDQGVEILPEPDDILAAYQRTALEDVRVVILGQDPYPTPGHAHGLAFSVQEDVDPLPKSLQNIYRELRSDLGCEEPPNGCLIPWTKQGVMLLNTSLSVQAKAPGSHSDLGWDGLVNETITLISERQPHVVFILWGKHALGRRAYIKKKLNHLILHSAHPSPMSADRGFFGSKPFSKTNKFLSKHGLGEIDWVF